MSVSPFIFGDRKKIEKIFQRVDRDVEKKLFPGSKAPRSRLSPDKAMELIREILGRAPRADFNFETLPFYSPNDWARLYRLDRELAGLLRGLVHEGSRLGQMTRKVVEKHLAKKGDNV